MIPRPPLTLEGLGAQASDADLTVLAAAPIVIPALSAAAKVGSTVAVTVNLVDAAGNAISRVQRCVAEVSNAAMVVATAITFTLAETGAGSEVSTTARPTLLFDTNSSGDATITITDVSGVYAGTVYLEVRPVSTGSGNLGVPCIISVSFA